MHTHADEPTKCPAPHSGSCKLTHMPWFTYTDTRDAAHHVTCCILTTSLLGAAQVPCGYGMKVAFKVVDETVRVLADMGKLPRRVPETLPSIQVGLEGKAQEVLQRLAASSKNMVLLHGMGGIGKTTLAKAVFNHLHALDYTVPSCFLQLDSSTKPSWDYIKQKQLELLRALAREHHVQLRSEAHAQQVLADKLEGKKALVVVDNLWAGGQLAALLPTGIMEVLGEGSTLIVTSCNRIEAVKGFETCIEFEVKLLSVAESTELFRRHLHEGSSSSGSSSNPSIKPEWEQKVLDGCGGLPAALKAVGRYLRAANWSKFFARQDAFLDAFQQVEPEPGSHSVFDVIKSSWDALSRDSLQDAPSLCEQQEALLDIVVFMKAQPRELVEFYCAAGVLEVLESLGLVRAHTGEAGLAESLLHSPEGRRRVSVHPVVEAFCTSRHKAELGRRMTVEVDELPDQLVWPCCPIALVCAALNSMNSLCRSAAPMLRWWWLCG
jgi:hypothetical protein